MDFLEGIFSFLAFRLEDLPFVIITLVIAFTVHEFAHAFVAYKMGDPTAKNEGRLTLNPLVHLDPIGTLLILLAGFGWARPVPVNRFRLRNPRLGGVLISLAGPLSNLLLAIIGVILQVIIIKFAGVNVGTEFINEFFNIFIWLNAILTVFNLIPLPPLDGFRIIQDLVDNQTRSKLGQFEVYGSIIFLVLVLVDPLYNVTLRPYMEFGINWIYELLSMIYNLIG